MQKCGFSELFFLYALLTLLFFGSSLFYFYKIFISRFVDSNFGKYRKRLRPNICLVKAHINHTFLELIIKMLFLIDNDF
jgi:hypothetical protein